MIVVVDGEGEWALEIEYGVGVSGPSDPASDVGSAQRGFIKTAAEEYVTEGTLERRMSVGDGVEPLLSILCRC